jgi:hypothetical protein
MSQKITKSLIGLSDVNDIYNDKFITSEDVTAKISKYFDESGGMDIYPQSSDSKGELVNFDSTTRQILAQELEKLSDYIETNKIECRLKIYVEVHDEEKKELIEKDYIVAKLGWRKKDKDGQVFENSSGPEDEISIGRSLASSALERAKELGKKGKDKAEELYGKAKDAVAGAGIGGIGLPSGTTPEKPSSDTIVYNEHNSERVKQLQRCLIRTAPEGNYKKEKESAAGYTPIVGTHKNPKAGNYADDGWFGPATLAAITKYKDILNNLNANNQEAQISDPRKVPSAIIISPACKGKIGTEPTEKEKAQPSEEEQKNALEKQRQVTTQNITKEIGSKTAPISEDEFKKLTPDQLKNTRVFYKKGNFLVVNIYNNTGTLAASNTETLEESKLYKEFSFLSSKNQKLHSTLMEQLKKDLKRG